ncbi:uncharacterized protein SCHCODRAFT_02013507 [Schizophyllum commune H4-8]|uniref:uncharacterized protein n=1 Tax=Schizophyllum commune (strain H4-8 / FGSC 9210) TaxID=578458 RepID=UPI00215E7243|nr:uncharacterized protein SCHCODRAFT_02013507 [Schizophyllum commune H4-8]KAI5899523.1 hypothetical protein SCHCODRAFT_02013507 [Schizophyllum commune H4-8]
MHDRGPDFGSRAVQTAWDGGRTRAKIARAPPGQMIMDKEAIVLARGTLVGKNNTASTSSKLGVDGSRTEDDKRGEDKKAGGNVRGNNQTPRMQQQARVGVRVRGRRPWGSAVIARRGRWGRKRGNEVLSARKRDGHKEDVLASSL